MGAGGDLRVRQTATVILSLFMGACASLPSPSTPVSPAPSRSATSREVREAEELRRALEHAADLIAARPAADATPADTETLSSMEIPDHDSVKGAVNYFSTDLKDKIQTSIERSAPYRSMIDQTLREEGLPRALGWLPVIESAFIPTLTSRAGAHGLWQFMPETAREYGLRVDWWVDERADPVRSTHAAAAYLRDLYQAFGDWSLALAAYNAGPGRVRRALDQQSATTFWDLYEAAALPRETRGYVPTFFATLILVSHPDQYGFNVPSPAPQDVRPVSIEGPVSLKWLAEVSGVDEPVLREMNPALRRGVVPPGPYAVRVPADQVSSLSARAGTLHFEDPYMQVSTYTLAHNDSVTRLASRLTVKADDLMEMNGLRSKKLAAGQSLFLPVSQGELSRRLNPTRGSARVHFVRRGDTLYAIARANGLSVQDLLDLNGFDVSHILQPGERIILSTPDTSSAASGGM